MQFYLRVFRYFRDDLGKIILSLALIGVGTLLGLLAPVPLAMFFTSMNGKPLDDNMLYRMFWFVPQDNSVRMVLILAAAMLVLRLAGEVLRMFQTQLNIVIGYHGRWRVQEDLFAKLQALSLKYHKSQPQGDAIYRLSWDTFGFQGVLNIVTGSLVNIVTLLVMVVIMLLMHWQLTLVALLVVPALFWTIKSWVKRLQEFNTGQREADSALTTQIQRSIATVGLVQAFNRQDDEMSRFTSRIRTYVDASLRLHWQEVLYWLVLGILLAIGSVAMFVWGGILTVRGELDIGALYLFITYLAMLYDPLNKLSGAGAGLQGGIAGVKRVFEVLDRDPTIVDAPNARSLAVQPRTLELDGVGFSYRDDAPVLRDVSVTIKPGEMVAFVGSSGVGKTTLLNLLPRFYDPTTGAMKLDGIDARQIKLRDLRHHIALVLQESVILPTSVAENIAYGRPNASAEQIRRAAELAGAAAFIEKLQKGYEEQVDESGQNLSGGQRQRIAIARALLTEAPIVVMDEPTSALDPQHEHLITQTLNALKGSRTIILVSHRLSTVAGCDQIFVMDEGRIVEQGRHDELVRQRGLYYQMAKHQMQIED